LRRQRANLKVAHLAFKTSCVRQQPYKQNAPPIAADRELAPLIHFAAQHWFIGKKLAHGDPPQHLHQVGHVTRIMQLGWQRRAHTCAIFGCGHGSLLNITDQLLKSWSMRGQIKYVRFPYPSPGSYPFPKPLMEQVHAPVVTFNWNTKGAGYVVEERGVEILALTRTGALPVDYLGDQDARLLEAEDRGYDYFSATGDPNLVRVVQYASLYQAFRRFGITTPETRVSPPKVTSAALRDSAASVVRRLRAADGENSMRSTNASARTRRRMRDGSR
jgi:hypothetical protein